MNPSSPTLEPVSTMSPSRVAIFYAVFAGLWILLSDALLAALFEDPETLALAGAVKGWLFVAVTSIMLFLVLRKRRGSAGWASSQRLLNLPFVVMALVLLGLVATAMIGTAHQRMETEAARLEALANVKADQIGDWYRGKSAGVAKIILNSVLLSDWYKRWRAGETDAQQQLVPRLLQLTEVGGFQGASLIEAGGVHVWRSEKAPPAAAPQLLATVQEALRMKAVRTTGLYRGLRGNVRLDVVVPLGAQAAVAVVLHADPREELYPMLANWPVPTRSGEAILFRRDGASIRYLSDLRHVPDAAVRFSVPLDAPELLASQAARASQAPRGLLEGLDYRGEPAFGVARPVPGTDWWLLVKEDRAETIHEASRSAIWIALAGLFALGTLGALQYTQRQRQQLQLSESTRQSQDERLKTLALLGAVLDHSEDFIFALDREGRFTLFNPAAERFTGIPASEVIGRDERAIFPPEIALRLIDENQRLMASGTSRTSDEALPGREGLRLCITSKSPLRDASGQVVGLCGINRDITQREATEARVRVSEERLQLAMDAASDALWDWNLPTGLAFLSPRYYAMCGYDPDEVTPDLAFYQSLVHPDDWPQVFAAFEAHLRGDTPSCDVEYRMIRRDRTELWVSCKSKVVARDADGRPLRMIGVASDITARKQADAALQNKSAELEARNAELERFNKAMIGRELDMVELKRQVNALSRELGRAPPYSVDSPPSGPEAAA